MTIQELRSEYKRLRRCDTIHDALDLLNIYLEYFFRVVRDHKENPKNAADNDAVLINQMIFSKAAYLRQLLSGIDYTAANGSKLNNIIDPTIVATAIRNLYETVGMFNLIYVSTKRADEKTILYNLWAHAGLMFRQRFESDNMGDEGKEKLEAEKRHLSELVDEIGKTELYGKLTDRDRGKIHNKLKEKDYKLRFVNDTIELLSWQDLIKPMGIKEQYMGKMYTYFSLYAHPSNVAVFQFADLFKKDNPEFLRMTIFNLSNAFFLFSVFIADYIKLFPNVIEIFNGLDIRDQIMINFYNDFVRGERDSINDACKYLG